MIKSPNFTIPLIIYKYHSQTTLLNFVLATLLLFSVCTLGRTRISEVSVSEEEDCFSRTGRGWSNWLLVSDGSFVSDFFRPWPFLEVFFVQPFVLFPTWSCYQVLHVLLGGLLGNNTCYYQVLLVHWLLHWRKLDRERYSVHVIVHANAHAWRLLVNTVLIKSKDVRFRDHNLPDYIPHC